MPRRKQNWDSLNSKWIPQIIGSTLKSSQQESLSPSEAVLDQSRVGGGPDAGDFISLTNKKATSASGS